MTVKEKIVACVNFTKINSIYTWQNKFENTTEFLAIFKTTDKKKKLLKDKIKKSHPYKVPEIAELKIKSINKPMLIMVHPTNEYLSIERVSLNKKALRFIDNQALEFLYFQ